MTHALQDPATVQAFFKAIKAHDVPKLHLFLTQYPLLINSTIKDRDINGADRERTPVEYAVGWEKLNAFETLLTYGAKITARALNDCCCDDMEEFLTAALKYKPDVNAQTEDGHFALEQAAITRDPFSMRTLLACDGINLNQQNEWGHTALHRAVEQCNLEVIPILLAANVDTTIKDENGLTAEDMAEEARWHMVTDMFEADRERHRQEERQKLKKMADQSIYTSGKIEAPAVKINPQRRSIKF